MELKMNKFADLNQQNFNYQYIIFKIKITSSGFFWKDNWKVPVTNPKKNLHFREAV